MRDSLSQSKNIINATGPGSNPRGTQPYRRMIQRKLLQPHELAGIVVDFRTLQVISPKTGKNPKIFALGGVTAGDYFSYRTYRNGGPTSLRSI